MRMCGRSWAIQIGADPCSRHKEDLSVKIRGKSELFIPKNIDSMLYLHSNKSRQVRSSNFPPNPFLPFSSHVPHHSSQKPTINEFSSRLCVQNIALCEFSQGYSTIGTAPPASQPYFPAQIRRCVQQPEASRKPQLPKHSFNGNIRTKSSCISQRRSSILGASKAL